MSEIQKSVELLAKTLSSKGEDYRGTRGEFFNFERAAEIAGITPLRVILGQLGIKVTRVQEGFTPGSDLNHESVSDSLLDLAGYAIIAHAYLRETG